MSKSMRLQFQKSSLSKEKLKFYNEETTKTTEVSHKSIVLKNLANKIASTESLNDDEFDSDASNDSTTSESGILNRSRKHSPKFVSEPNLSVLDTRNDDETPKNTKKRGSRLFRSKIVLASQSLNKKYQKRTIPIRSTPTCVSCFDDQDTGSETESPCRNNDKDQDCADDSPIVKRNSEGVMNLKLHYLTSTPGISEKILDEESCTTPYMINFRRASMSPITKSTQKLSKAMQVCLLKLLFNICMNCHCVSLILYRY